MKHLKHLLWKAGISALRNLACIATLFANAPYAFAQAAYGSYIGIGGSVGGGGGNDFSNAAVIAIRYKLLEIPVSLRAQAFLNSDGATIVPTVSYDIPLNWQTDAYVGAGVSFASGNTPVGDKTSFTLQPGIDYALPDSRIVLFGNAIIAFDAYRQQGGAAFSLQGGVGLRF